MTLDEIIEAIETLSLKELCEIFRLTSEILISRVDAIAPLDEVN